MIIVYITNPSQAHAERVAARLLEQRLIACANIIPSTSMYRWNDALRNEKEFILIAKTTEAQYVHLRKSVEQMHEYEIPCILKFKAEANAPFAAWVDNEVQ